MKKNLLFKFVLFVIPITGVLVLNSFSGGAPAGRTGSPGDGGLTCEAAGCHVNSGADNAQGAHLSSTDNLFDMGTAYTLGQTYSVTVSVDFPVSVTPTNGFQITAEDAMDNKVGNWTSPDGNTQVINGGTHVTHTLAGNGESDWTFNWEAPATDEGPITFYVAVNAANGNGNASGDEIFTESITVSNVVLATQTFEQAGFTLYPNPVVRDLQIDFPEGITTLEATVYELSGRQLFSTKINPENNIVHTTHLANGMYFILLQNGSKKYTSSFLKR